MPIPEKYQVDFYESGIYHVFNRTNNKETLFITDENRLFFLRKYDEYLSPYLETYAWCLLPNHFHLLVKVKSITEINMYLNTFDSKLLTLTEKKFQKEDISFSELIEHSFKRFFQCYALAFNKVYKRNGNLFYKPFKRIEIDKESHFTQAIIYIHVNAAKHGLIKDLSKWKWSSWHSYLTESPTKLRRQEVLEWFGGKDQFIQLHEEMTDYYNEGDISIED
jgi:putative transposase